MREMPPGDIEESRRLGRAAVAALFAVAAEAPRGAVIESVFYRSKALPDIRSLPGAPVEIFCRCDRAATSARYHTRTGTRHRGHFDDERTPDELWHPEIIEPVAGGWPVVVVDTNHSVDVPALLARIELALPAT